MIEDDEQSDMQEKESKRKTKILSIGLDLLYNISGGKQWTPKLLALASTLHQATRSKVLAQLFDNTGHIISYDNALPVETAIAEKVKQAMSHTKQPVTLAAENQLVNIEHKCI